MVSASAYGKQLVLRDVPIRRMMVSCLIKLPHQFGAFQKVRIFLRESVSSVPIHIQALASGDHDFTIGRAFDVKFQDTDTMQTR